MIEPIEATNEPDGPRAELIADTADGLPAVPTPPPVIVIQYPQRGLVSRLTPPALILLAALAITAFQRVTPIRPIASQLGLDVKERPKVEPPGTPFPAPRLAFRPQKPAEEVAATATVKAAVPNPELAVSESSLAAAPTDALVSSATEARTPSPFDLDPVPGLTPRAANEPPAPEPAPASAPTAARSSPPVFVEAVAEPEPPAPEREAAADTVSKDEILRDIKREADERDAQREDMERIKPRAQAILAAEARTAAVARIGEERIPFRNELRQVLKEGGNEAGPEIDRLCDQFERDTRPELRSAYLKTIFRISSRMPRELKVEKMRAFAIPEPMILDAIANEFHRTMNSRGGPRDENEVRVRAARELLKYPVATTGKPTQAAQVRAGATLPALPRTDPR